MTVQGKIVVQPLVGADRDEITALVMRIKQADDRAHAPHTDPTRRPVPTQDLKWAEDWQLPREMFDYFELDHTT